MLEKLFNISAIIKILKVGNFDVIQTNGGAKCHTSAYVMNFRALVPPAIGQILLKSEIKPHAKLRQGKLLRQVQTMLKVKFLVLIWT